MQVLLLILSGVGWAVDLVLLVLDLNYWLVSSLVSFLCWTIHFIFSLPGAISLTLLQCWECAWLGMTAVGDCCCGLVVGAVQTAGNMLGGALAGLDSLQLAWNLVCHLGIRSKEMMQRGLLNIALSGQNLHRQVWEALTIGGSLAAYLVNTLVNLFLIGVQYVCSGVLSLWLGVVNVIFMSKEWIIAMFSQLSNTAVTVVILLWAPFKMAVDIFVLCSTNIGVIMFKHLYEVLLLLFLIWVSRMFFRPSPAARFLQEKLNMFYQTLLVCLQIILSSDVWRRVVDRSLQLLRIYGAAWYRSVNRVRTRAQDAPPRTNRVPEPAQPPNLPPPRLNFYMQPNPRRNAAADRGQTSQQAPPAPQCSASTSRENKAAAEDPWRLLKQQEESRKCVICQDQPKSILLLPCRHLCLCARCTNILQQQPILQRNCPLCRQMILQTLNVYM
ncbi:PREDICTED: RING finger protein 26 [Nanorana parkeri]|uniref:RING finger protein 26 n=1 Tax=Nanorana parkeri TaxID=125878 RepID=UPI00085417B8|nr:PREDICTED: RING finger protein 26 [Nanorana parkeri]